MREGDELLLGERTLQVYGIRGHTAGIIVLWGIFVIGDGYYLGVMLAIIADKLIFRSKLLDFEMAA
ncbi:hypothetical protein SAMN05444401_0898 [Clostridium amylolyticum]|uniref:Uncharacterized protein n=1 Tax=Clostridium amylolyticum TaxID=1121298 RepID=A0A1M6BUG0_9CLOT|nr:hypothetical protein SAMN05444401_0898 [Clostridium amylolyticum]